MVKENWMVGRKWKLREAAIKAATKERRKKNVIYIPHPTIPKTMIEVEVDIPKEPEEEGKYYLINKREEKKPPLTIEGILESVSECCGIPKEKILERTRKREIVEARQVVQFLSRTLFPKTSLSEIARQTGDMDHASILHSIKTVDNLWQTSSEFRAKWHEVM